MFLPNTRILKTISYSISDFLESGEKISVNHKTLHVKLERRDKLFHSTAILPCRFGRFCIGDSVPGKTFTTQLTDP